MKFFKRLFCKHPRIEFYRNIYGDEVWVEMNWRGYIFRSWWWCPDCGALVKREELGKEKHDNRTIESHRGL